MAIVCIALFIFIIIDVCLLMRLHELKLENYDLIDDVYKLKNQIKRQQEKEDFRNGFLV